MGNIDESPVSHACTLTRKGWLQILRKAHRIKSRVGSVFPEKLTKCPVCFYFPDVIILYVAEITLFYDIGIIIVSAAILSHIAGLFKQSPLTFYILSGLLLGPHGISLIANKSEIVILAELGVAFLLFIAGLEINIKDVGVYGKYTLVAGALQVLITFVVGAGISSFIGFGWTESLYMGLVIANSSTMIVTKILVDRNLVNSLRGRTALGILIVQDIAFVLALPFLQSTTAFSSSTAVIDLFAKGFTFVFISILGGLTIIPSLLKKAAKNDETFLLTSTALCFIFIGLAISFGFSIAIGGLMGGLVLSTPYNKGIIANVRTLRDFFTIIFFSSIGLQLTVVGIESLLFPFIVFFLAVVVLKPLIIAMILGTMGFGTRTPIMVGVLKGQVSELSYVLASQGLVLGQISQGTASIIMALTLFTSVITPYLFSIGDKLSISLYKRYPKGIISNKRISGILSPKETQEDHIILIGCHRTGREVLHHIKDMKYIIIDHDPEIVDALKNHNCIYGVPDNHYTLDLLGVRKARFIIITAPDYQMASFVTEEAKKVNKKIKIMARATNIEEALGLYRAGADIVMVPEVLTGREMAKKLGEMIKGKDFDKEREEHIAAFGKAFSERFLI